MTGEPDELARLAGAERAGSVEQAAATVNHVVFSATQAVGSDPKSVWLNDIGQVIEVYPDGLSVLTEEPEYGADPEKY